MRKTILLALAAVALVAGLAASKASLSDGGDPLPYCPPICPKNP